MLIFSVYNHWSRSWLCKFVRRNTGTFKISVCAGTFHFGIVQAAYLTRMIRSSLLDVLHMNYIHMARSKGLKERTVI